MVIGSSFLRLFFAYLLLSSYTDIISFHTISWISGRTKYLILRKLWLKLIRGFKANASEIRIRSFCELFDHFLLLASTWVFSAGLISINDTHLMPILTMSDGTPQRYERRSRTRVTFA